MSETYFTKLLIADLINKEAAYQEFTKGFNVVTGHENHVGKSTILKSILHALGTEVYFSSKWTSNQKLYVLVINVNNVKYNLARWHNRFLLFKGNALVMVTDKVTKGLAQKLAEIFSFYVYLPSKNNKELELAPPAFTFLPYYIDQDKGWGEMYQSFLKLDQYNKADRLQCLYYHLGIFNKDTLALSNERDDLKRIFDQKLDEENRLRITIDNLTKEVNNLVPADNLDMLNENLRISKDRIENSIRKLGDLRNKIQELETMLHENYYHASIIKKIKKNNQPKELDENETCLRCPNCGYNITKDIFELVRSKYSEVNKKYIYDQIEYINNMISADLDKYKYDYIQTMQQMKQDEYVYNSNRDEYQTYLSQSGLRATLDKFNKNLTKLLGEKEEINNKLTQIRKKMRSLDSKHEIEDVYREYVKSNFRKLDVWDEEYINNIELLRPIKGQGGQVNKIVLAQFSALFKTMEHYRLEQMRFPFVVDSPRTNESSELSSQEIINIVFELKMLPQVILATTDFEKYYKGDIQDFNIITLDRPNHLLDEGTYEQNRELIDRLMAYFNSNELFGGKRK